jgi:ArsR family metal-binding transcriptional regulator
MEQQPGDEFIAAYRLEVTSPPCEPGAERYSAFAHLTRDISELMPYVNAVWAGAIYDQDGKSLVATRLGKRVALHANEVVAELNAIWRRRAEITPRYDMRQRPNPLSLYRLLPHTNCKACGEPTCFVFASKLAAGQVDLEACLPLQSEEYAEKLKELQTMLAKAQ